MELTLDTPARYRIRVKGYLDSSWSDRLGGLDITTSSQEDVGPTVTTLRGDVLDQAALAGVLNTLQSAPTAALGGRRQPPGTGETKVSPHPGTPMNWRDREGC